MCIFVLRMLRRSALCVPIALGWLTMLAAAPDAAGQQVDVTPLGSAIDSSCSDVESRVIAWRRDIHQHPELSNREVRTAKLVADHLRQLGLEVKTEVAHTGVVGILRGMSTARVVALRADMDALPVTEAVDVPFASKVTTQYGGQTVGVMHACGHDAHVAILIDRKYPRRGAREHHSWRGGNARYDQGPGSG